MYTLAAAPVQRMSLAIPELLEQGRWRARMLSLIVAEVLLQGVRQIIHRFNTRRLSISMDCMTILQHTLTFARVLQKTVAPIMVKLTFVRRSRMRSAIYLASSILCRALTNRTRLRLFSIALLAIRIRNRIRSMISCTTHSGISLVTALQ